MSHHITVKAASKALSIAKTVYQRLGAERISHLFESAKRTYTADGRVDDETAWQVFEASLDGTHAETIFQAAQRAILTASPLAVSLMGVLVGKLVKGEKPVTSSSEAKVLRALMDIDDLDLIFMGNLLAIRFAIERGERSVPMGVQDPDNLDVIGPGTAINMAAGLGDSVDPEFDGKLEQLKSIQVLGSSKSAKYYYHPSAVALDIGRLWVAFNALPKEDG